MMQLDMERKSKNPPRTNLPAALTSFVGRKREIADIPALLASTCLLSLVDAGVAARLEFAGWGD